MGRVSTRAVKAVTSRHWSSGDLVRPLLSAACSLYTMCGQQVTGHQAHLVLSVDLSDHVLLLLHGPQVLLPPRLLHDVFVVTTSLAENKRISLKHAFVHLEAICVKGLESVETLVSAVVLPVPPDAGGPGELGNDPRHGQARL